MTVYMRVFTIFVFSMTLIAGSESSASAQERSVGLLVAAPTLIGVDLPISSRLAVRPAIAFNHTSTDSTTASSGNSTSSTGFAFSITAPMILQELGPTGIYITPRFRTQRFTTDTNSSFGGLAYTEWSFGGAVGVQGEVATRFLVFGEAGFDWSKRTGDDDSAFPADSTSTGTVATVGVVFRFK